MAKKNKENDIVTDGSRAITKFHVSDVVMVVILVILCATCVVPFIHLLAKSVSSNTAVLAKRVSFWPIGFNLDAYTSIFEDGSMVRSFLYSVIVYLNGYDCLYMCSLSTVKKEIKGKNILYLYPDVSYVF